MRASSESNLRRFADSALSSVRSMSDMAATPETHGTLAALPAACRATHQFSSCVIFAGFSFNTDMEFNTPVSHARSPVSPAHINGSCSPACVNFLRNPNSITSHAPTQPASRATNRSRSMEVMLPDTTRSLGLDFCPRAKANRN